MNETYEIVLIKHAPAWTHLDQHGTLIPFTKTQAKEIAVQFYSFFVAVLSNQLISNLDNQQYLANILENWSL